MDKNALIYVAGREGLVGSNFIRRLQEKGYSNILHIGYRELDLRDQKAVHDFFAAHKPEYVFLAAAKVGGILANNTYKAEFIYDNIMIAANVINAAYCHGVKKLLNLGSSCIYPKLAPQPLKEEHLLTGALEPTNEPYAIAKISAIKLCRYYNEQYGTNFISVMPTNLYGPGDNFNLETGHVLPALLRKFHLAKLLKTKDYEMIKKDVSCYGLGFGIGKDVVKEDMSRIEEKLRGIGVDGEGVTLWGSGKVFREFLYVNDLVEAAVFLMEHYDYKQIGEFVNIGTGEDITINGLAELIRTVVHYDGKIRYDAGKPDGTPQKLLDISNIKKLGWRPTVALKDGVKMLYDWYLKTLGCNS